MRNREQGLEEGVPSSPDGFSSDSLMDEDHEVSDGVSSVSDLEGRIHPSSELGEPGNYGASLVDPLSRDVSRRFNKRSRGGKRFDISVVCLMRDICNCTL